MVYIWLAAVFVFAVLEAAATGLNFIWFSVGSLVAMFAAMLSAPLWLQLIIFVLVSAVSLYLTRPLVKKYFNNKREHTNADRIIGKSAVVEEEINNVLAQGAVKVNGQIWSATSENGEIIPIGASVTVTDIRGVRAIVKQEN